MDLRLLLFSIWAGDRNPSIGVFRYSKMLRYGSLLESAAFLIRFLAMSTAFSTWPFACGQLGLDVACWKSHSLANC